jgi:hypothetical protein
MIPRFTALLSSLVLMVAACQPAAPAPTAAPAAAPTQAPAPAPLDHEFVQSATDRKVGGP